MPDAQGNDPMRCAGVKGDITLRRNQPCSGDAVAPRALVSFGFNMRLHRRAADGRPVLLSSKVLEEAASVPLLWDVDGEAAAARNLVPVFSAPDLGEGGMLAEDRFWFPAARHNGAANYAFIDGHVESSTRPLDMAGWNWTYVPR
jgi:prepilin-type processing-associated H-X9-DG protein